MSARDLLEKDEATKVYFWSTAYDQPTGANQVTQLVAGTSIAVSPLDGQGSVVVSNTGVTAIKSQTGGLLNSGIVFTDTSGFVTARADLEAGSGIVISNAPGNEYGLVLSADFAPVPGAGQVYGQDAYIATASYTNTSSAPQIQWTLGGVPENPKLPEFGSGQLWRCDFTAFADTNSLNAGYAGLYLGRLPGEPTYLQSPPLFTVRAGKGGAFSGSLEFQSTSDWYKHLMVVVSGATSGSVRFSVTTVSFTRLA